MNSCPSVYKGSCHFKHRNCSSLGKTRPAKLVQTSHKRISVGFEQFIYCYNFQQSTLHSIISSTTHIDTLSIYANEIPYQQ